AVLGRRAGLRRPTLARAIARTLEEREREFYQQYEEQGRRRGIPDDKVGTWAQKRVEHRLRGSEAPARAVVRMRVGRYVDRIEAVASELASPIASEPLSGAIRPLLNMLLENGEAAVVYAHAATVRDRFRQSVQSPQRRTAGVADARRVGILESENW